MSLEAVATVAFWVSVGVLCYVYLLYPLIVHALARLLGRPVRRGKGLCPIVTVVITAYNEEKNITAKIHNVLESDYPPELLEVMVVSDGSSDGTDDLVRRHATERVKLLRVEGRVGKTGCQNEAVTKARGEIVVFTDATTYIKPDALALLMENFADPGIGCVAGLLVYRGKGRDVTSAGGVSYWGYEIALRRAESRLCTLIGVSGCLYAVRRSAYRPIAPALISDFLIATRMRDQGLRTVLDERATCVEETLDRSRQELSMRVRVALRSIDAMVSEGRFLNPFADPAYAWQLWSHKLLRYASVYFILMMLGACVDLTHYTFYRWALAAQLAGVVAGITGFMLDVSGRRVGLLGKPYYFLLTNLASIIATVRFLRGHRIVTWNPIR